MPSQRSHSFAWRIMQDKTIQHLCSRASQHLTYSYPADRAVIEAVPMPISGFKVHRTKDDVAKVSYRGWLVPSSIPVPIKTHCVGERCMLNLSRAQTSSHWCGS
ncbi:hypothetical protein TNCV_3367311 [Trichonephila clavipes]|nr:hypothetical protein TNCV_3367311 [Trichonephila clavipes]